MSTYSPSQPRWAGLFLTGPIVGAFFLPMGAAYVLSFLAGFFGCVALTAILVLVLKRVHVAATALETVGQFLRQRGKGPSAVLLLIYFLPAIVLLDAVGEQVPPISRPALLGIFLALPIGVYFGLAGWRTNLADADD